MMEKKRMDEREKKMNEQMGGDNGKLAEKFKSLKVGPCISYI